METTDIYKKKKSGIKTGDNHSFSMVNIVVRCILQTIADVLNN